MNLSFYIYITIIIIYCYYYSPGPVFTGFIRSMGLDESATENMFEALTSQSLLKRLGKPDDIANLVSFLASDEDARNITGSIMVNDSGYLTYAPNINREEIIKYSSKH